MLVQVVEVISNKTPYVYGEESLELVYSEREFLISGIRILSADTLGTYQIVLLDGKNEEIGQLIWNNRYFGNDFEIAKFAMISLMMPVVRGSIRAKVAHELGNRSKIRIRAEKVHQF